MYYIYNIHICKLNVVCSSLLIFSQTKTLFLLPLQSVTTIFMNSPNSMLDLLHLFVTSDSLLNPCHS